MVAALSNVALLFLDCEQQYLLIVKRTGKLDARLYAQVQRELITCRAFLVTRIVQVSQDKIVRLCVEF